MNIFSDLHVVGSAKWGGGQLTFAGFDDEGYRNSLEIALDNVVLDATPPTFSRGRNGAPEQLPAATHFSLGRKR